MGIVMKMSNFMCTVCMVWLQFAVLILVWSGVSCTQDSIQVLRVELTCNDDIQWINRLREHLEEEKGADFWSLPEATSQHVDVLLPEHFIDQFKKMLDDRNVQYTVMIEDVYQLVNDQMKAINKRLNTGSKSNDLKFDYGVYHTYEEIRRWVRDFAAEHSDIAEEFVVTQSYHGRDVAGVKLSVPNGRSNKKSVWFEGGIHAREWVSPATVLFITNQLVQDYKAGDTDAQKILNNLDFYIVPSLNVDGYAYTWRNSRSRLWRKTRSRNKRSICKGTDGNRNWPYEWGGIRASTNPCNETFRGSGPASEVEIQGVIDFTTRLSEEQEFAVFIDWHSYSQAWMSPWSYSAQEPLPKDANDQLALAEAAVQAIKSVHKTIYRSGPAATTLYEASGFSIDWSYAVLNAKYSYCVELRDTGKYGFLLPEDQIIPTGEECYAAVKVVGKWVVNEYAPNEL